MAEPMLQSGVGKVRFAVVEDIPQLRELEVQAAQLFRDVPGLASFAEDGPSLSIERQKELIEKERIWVVVVPPSAPDSGATIPVAYLAADVVDCSLHIFELSTSPSYQRRGFAKILIDAATEHAQILGLSNLSLTTERHVAWNGPMYQKRGFEEVEASQLGPQHEKIIEKEQEDGLDVSRRCTMAKYLSAS